MIQDTVVHFLTDTVVVTLTETNTLASDLHFFGSVVLALAIGMLIVSALIVGLNTSSKS